jgi:anti-sigma regulatory factor (Ser/Thr protein kinase)
VPIANFPAEPTGVTAARHFVKDMLASDVELAEAAELLVSELASNVVRHARTDFSVEVVRGPQAVRVVVEDGSAIEIAVKELESGADSGRGLRIVETLSNRCGTQSTASRKQVWFELDIQQV